MQQIERYGVIALVFFLVTIVAVSFWGDNKSPGFWSRLTGRGVKKDTTADNITPAPATSEAGLQSPVPLTSDPLAAGTPANGTQANGTVQPVTAHDATLVPLGSNASALTNDPNALVQSGAPLPPANTAGTPAPSNPVAPPAGAQAAGTPHEYTVQKGDSLAGISKKTLGKESRWSEIVALNPGLNPKNLKVGAKLVLPGDAGAQPSVATPTDKPALKESAHKSSAPKLASANDAPAKTSSKAPETKKTAAHTYKVQKGDTYKAIARRELGDEGRWKEIAALNAGVDASKLTIGQSLRLPGGESRPLVAADLSTSVASSKPRVR